LALVINADAGVSAPLSRSGFSGPEGSRGAPILTDPRAASPASPLALPAMSIDAPAALHHRRRCLWRCKKARRIAPAGLSRHVMRTSARERVTTARRG
jgi:hypothetical protein